MTKILFSLQNHNTLEVDVDVYTSPPDKVWPEQNKTMNISCGFKEKCIIAPYMC